MSGDLLIHGAGTILSGELARPRVLGDAVLIREGRIVAIGSLDDVRPADTVQTVDIGGATLAPGLIDPHTHPVLGDYTPRQGTTGWITSYLNGGVTTLISAGEPHWPGRPRTAAGVKAIAIAAHQSARNLRPGGASNIVMKSPEGQEIAAKNYYRPRNAEVLAKYKDQFPAITLFTVDELFGGWAKAQPRHFNDGGLFDKIYQPTK